MKTTQAEQWVAACQTAMSHAWMVRTFVKHSDEVEDFPELMQLPRTVFDMARALETRVDDPSSYHRMLQKKIGKLRRAVEQFAVDAPKASTHTNFVQAVHSLRGTVERMDELLQHAPAASESARDDAPE